MTNEQLQVQTLELQDKREFWWVVVDVAVLRDKRLSVYAKAVYAVLCTFADRGGRECWPTVQTIAETACVSERTAQRAMSQLIELGYVQKRDRFKANQQITSLYTIIGHKAAEKTEGGVTLTPPGRPSVTPGVSDSHPDLEPLESLKDTLPTVEAAEAPAVDKKPEIIKAEQQEQETTQAVSNLSKVPEVMHATVEYFVYKTGALPDFTDTNGDDYKAVRSMMLHHTPARVQKEINTAVERYLRHGRPLNTLTLLYIWQSLEHQPDTLRPRAQPVKKLAGISAETRRRQEETMKKLGV